VVVAAGVPAPEVAAPPVDGVPGCAGAVALGAEFGSRRDGGETLVEGAAVPPPGAGAGVTDRVTGALGAAAPEDVPPPDGAPAVWANASLVSDTRANTSTSLFICAS